ncbi:MAG: pre-peptidase C-terminal domain-containing protein [Anaerolineae bacterium]
MRLRTFALILLTAALCTLAPAAFAQDSGTPATPADKELFSAALANISGANSYAFDVYLDIQAAADSSGLQILLEGEGAFDQTGESPALALDLRGRISGDGEEVPVDFALRIKDEVLYYNNVAGSDTRPELWTGVPMSVVPALINSQLGLVSLDNQGDSTIGDALNTAASTLLEFFNASGMDPESFLTLTRLPDGDSNGTPITRMELDISLSNMAKAEGFSSLLTAMTTTEDQPTGVSISDADLDSLATSLAQTDVQFKVRIDPTTEIFQSGELVVNSTLDPSAVGNTGSPATFSLDLLVSLRDIGEAQAITVPDGINVLSADSVAALIQSQTTPVATPNFVFPTPTAQVTKGALPPAATPTQIPTETPSPLPPTATPSPIPQASPTSASSAGGELSANTPAEIVLSGNGPVELTYNGTRGELITVSARSVDASTGLDTTVELLDPNGVRVGFNDDLSGSKPGFNSLDSVIENVKLPSDGVYSVVVNSFAPGISGPVEVLLISGNAPVPTPGTSSQTYPIVTAEQRTVPANGSDCVGQELLAGETVSVVVHALDAALDTQVAVTAPDGSQFAFNDDHGTNDTSLGRFDSVISAQPVTASGEYSLCVSGFAGSNGSYELTVTRQSGGTSISANPTATPSGSQPQAQMITGEIAADEQFETPFDAQAGDVFTITVRATGGDLDPQVGVFADNENDLLFYNDDQGDTYPDLAPTDSVISNLIIQETGTYDVLVAGYDTTSGTFEVTIERTATGAPLGTPEVQTASGKLQSNGVYTYNVTLPEGAYVTITVMAGDDVFDPQLTLVDPNGVVVATNDDHSSEDDSLRFTDSRIRNFFVTTPGEYTVEIRGYQGSGGPFSLTIAVLQ